MQLHRVDPFVGATLHAAGGQLARLQALARAEAGVFSGVLHLAPGGKLGPHEASVPRIVLVVRGSGRVVTPGTSGQADLRPGDVVLWEKGESLEIETTEGLMGVILEGADLQILAPADRTRTVAAQGSE